MVLPLQIKQFAHRVCPQKQWKMENVNGLSGVVVAHRGCRVVLSLVHDLSITVEIGSFCALQQPLLIEPDRAGRRGAQWMHLPDAARSRYGGTKILKTHDIDIRPTSVHESSRIGSLSVVSKNLLVLGTGTNQDEDAASVGRIVLLEVIVEGVSLTDGHRGRGALLRARLEHLADVYAASAPERTSGARCASTPSAPSRTMR